MAPQGLGVPSNKKRVRPSAGRLLCALFARGDGNGAPKAGRSREQKMEPARRLAPGMALFVSQPVTVREVMWGLAPSYQ